MIVSPTYPHISLEVRAPAPETSGDRWRVAEIPDVVRMDSDVIAVLELVQHVREDVAVEWVSDTVAATIDGEEGAADEVDGQVAAMVADRLTIQDVAFVGIE